MSPNSKITRVGQFEHGEGRLRDRGQAKGELILAGTLEPGIGNHIARIEKGSLRSSIWAILGGSGAESNFV